MQLKRNDLEPALRATLKDADGPVNLTGLTVRFLMRDSSGILKASGLCTLVDAPNGVVTYSWQSGDTDTAGDYTAEFEVTVSVGRTRTFPNGGYIQITIVEDLGP
jgi:hypothetical protein